MKNSQSRVAFSMIELIFVIVLLGILMAVALPKFVGVSNHAMTEVSRAFATTLTRTVGNTFWNRSIFDGKNGDITYGSDPTLFDGKPLTSYTTIPIYFDVASVNFHNCGAIGEEVDPFLRKKTDGGLYNIFCRNGTSRLPVIFEYSKDEKFTFAEE